MKKIITICVLSTLMGIGQLTFACSSDCAECLYGDISGCCCPL